MGHLKLRRMSYRGRAARLCWFAAVALGAMACAWSLSECLRLGANEWMQLIALLSLVIIVSSYPVRIPNTTTSVTVGDAFTFLSVLFLGVPAAVVLGVVDSFLSARRTMRLPV